MIIPVSKQDDVISSFWVMLKECEAKANDTNDAVLKHFVDCWFRQWNSLTGQNRKAVWDK